MEEGAARRGLKHGAQGENEVVRHATGAGAADCNGTRPLVATGWLRGGSQPPCQRTGDRVPDRWGALRQRLELAASKLEHQAVALSAHRCRARDPGKERDLADWVT